MFHVKHRAGRLHSTGVETVTSILEAVGVTLLTAAAWLVGVEAGLAATGAACIAVSYTLTRNAKTPKRRPR